MQWNIGSQTGVFPGYEIHMGHTQVGEGVAPRFFLRPLGGGEWRPDGAVSRDGRVWGTYLHGLFESGSFLRQWLAQVGAERGVQVQVGWQEWPQERDAHLNRIADALEEHLDMVTIQALAGVTSL